MDVRKNPQDYCVTKEVSEILGKSLNWARFLIHTGKLGEPVRLGPSLLVQRKEVLAYLKYQQSTPSRRRIRKEE